MALARSIVGQRPPKGRVEAERDRHAGRARIRHGCGDAQSSAFNRITHIELERKRVTLKRSFTGAEAEAALRWVCFFDLEARRAGKAMPEQLVLQPVDTDAIVSRTTYDGKEQG